MDPKNVVAQSDVYDTITITMTDDTYYAYGPTEWDDYSILTINGNTVVVVTCDGAWIGVFNMNCVQAITLDIDED